MTLPLKISAPVTITVAFLGALLGFLGVPNEQVVPADYPNVMFVQHSSEGPTDVVPLRYDNQTLPPVSTAHLGGLYQHTLFFWHDRLDKFEVFEERTNLRVWECFMFCHPLNATSRGNVYLIHSAPHREKPKSTHQWWLVEMRERDTETPVIYARTKGRKNLQIDGVPWVEPDTSRTKPKVLNLQLFSIWDVLWPGLREPHFVKWGAWVAFIAAAVAYLYKLCKDDDDFD